MCVFYYCRTYYKAVRVGGEESGGHVLRETTSRGLCGLVCPSRTGTREEPGTLIQGAPVFPRSSRAGTRDEPGTLTQGAPVFPGSSRLGNEPKTPGWLVQDPTTSPSGDLIPTIRGSGAHPGRGWHGVCLLLQYLLQSCSRVCGGEQWRTCATRDYEPRAEACED